MEQTSMNFGPETVSEFVARLGITSKCEEIGARPDGLMNEYPGSQRHYLVRLTRNEKAMELYYSMGVALEGEPTTEDVLSSLGSDASLYESASDLYDFATSLGYQGQNEARAIYEACARNFDSLRSLTGEAELTKLAYEVEED